MQTDPRVDAARAGIDGRTPGPVDWPDLDQTILQARMGTRRMSEFVTVAKVGSIPEGSGAAFAVGDRMVAVFNDGGEYFAIDDVCPHMGASLAGGPLAEGIVTCPWHAWRFCVHDGTWRDNPRLKIDRFRVRVEGDEIQVCPDPEPEAPADAEGRAEGLGPAGPPDTGTPSQ